jgi:hypothetical protein
VGDLHGVEQAEGDRVMRKGALRRLRTLAAAAVCGSVALVAMPTHSGAIVLPTSFVSLHGEGAWSITGELVDWQNELASAKSAIDLNYTPNGTILGREDLALNQSDYAISGVGWQPGELDKVKGGASAFISAPVQVSTLVNYIEPTFQNGGARFRTAVEICNPDDPSTWPPGVTHAQQCVVRSDYTGPVHIPNENLAAMYMQQPGDGDLPLYSWNNPSVLAAFGLNPDTDAITDHDAVFPALGPGTAIRSDGDEDTYYLQQFVKNGAPDVWNDVKSTAPLGVSWEPITERYAIQPSRTSSRNGAEQEIELLAANGCGVDGNACGSPNAPTGGLTAAPPSALARFRSTFPQAPIIEAPMQNANGDWVSPTPDAINKAVDAGGDTPLYALTNNVPGAYPLVWVDRLYAPAHGLSVAKTEGLAMLIRYLVTTGQTKEAAAGDGQLTPALVDQALQSANQLVTSNCVGSDRKVVASTDPGPLAPDSATAMKSIGTMMHCEPVESATTTTTVPGGGGGTGDNFGGGDTFNSGGSVTGDGSSFSSGSSTGGATTSGYTSSDGGSGSSGGSTASGGGSTAPGHGGSGNALLVASQLPIPAPGGASGTDRLATFLLGAFLYLLFRKPIGRFFHRIAAKV